MVIMRFNMSDSDSAVIETKDLSKRFKEVQAVSRLNMKVRKGEIFGFLGPNGAGKTTTIKMIMGLTHPTDGEVKILGEKVSPDTFAIRENIGYLPERVSFYDNLTPVQTMNFFCELKRCDKSQVNQLISEVGLDDAKNRKMGTFSKGMTQLVGVAQAMIGSPSIFILDEPMGGLDARWVKVVREKIMMLNEKGATIIFSSHILSEVQNLCDRVAIIDKGSLIAEDTITNLSQHLHMKPMLEISVPDLDGKVPQFLLDIDGVDDVSVKGDTLYVICDSQLRLTVIEKLKENGMEITDFKTKEPSLEDAFVKLISQGGLK
jgi:ABC-2 type transport system ATP-binding protein